MSTPVHHRGDDIVVVGIWLLVGVWGVFTNLLIILSIVKNRRMSQSTSYWLMLSLSFCDLSMLLITFAHILPATTYHEDFLPLYSFQNAFGIFLYDSFWYAGVIHLTLMALNRYTNICHPKQYAVAFCPRKTVLYIIVAFIIGIAIAAPGLHQCCVLVYNYYIYAVQYKAANTPYSYVDIIVNGVSILAMIFCYAEIVLRVRRSRLCLKRYRTLFDQRQNRFGNQSINQSISNRNQSSAMNNSSVRQNCSSGNILCLPLPLALVSRREIRLVFQFCSVSVIFLLTWSTWQWLPYLNEHNQSKWVGFAVTTMFFINNCTNPTVYLIFNSALRQEVGELLCFFTKREQLATLSTFDSSYVNTRTHACFDPVTNSLQNGTGHVIATTSTPIGPATSARPVANNDFPRAETILSSTSRLSPMVINSPVNSLDEDPLPEDTENAFVARFMMSSVTVPCRLFVKDRSPDNAPWPLDELEFRTEL